MQKRPNVASRLCSSATSSRDPAESSEMVPSRNAFKQLQYKQHEPALAFPARTQLQQAQRIQQLFPGSGAPLFALPSQQPRETASHLSSALPSSRFPGALTEANEQGCLYFSGAAAGAHARMETSPKPGLHGTRRAPRAHAKHVVFVCPAPRPAT